jgi:hypothetical protein
MGNMSYCRFENTVSDLGDCQLALEDLLMGDSNPLSDSELNKARELISTCADILALVQEQSGMDRREFLNKMDDDSQETINQILNNAQENARGLE